MNSRSKYQWVKKGMAIFMMAVFFFATTPHALIHDFTGHKDTVDVYGKGITFSKHHIHCEFLQIAIAPYLPGGSVHIPSQDLQHAFLVQRLPVLHSWTRVSTSFLRGPPSMI